MTIRVLHIVFSLDPGGLENGLVNVACRLPSDRFQVDVCCLEHKGAFAERLPDHSRVLVLNKRPGKSPATVAKLCAYVALTRPHIVHTHNLGPLIHGVWATLGGVLAPIIHGEHGEVMEDELTPRRISQRKRCFKRCRAIHTVSHDLSRQIESTFGVHPVQTIVNGVDSVRFRPGMVEDAKAAYGVAPDAFVVGVVGRFVEIKRQFAVVEAFRRVAESHPNLVLLMPGDGPTLPTVRAAVQDAGLEDRVILPGFLENPEDAYHAMDAMLLPSLIEGLSNVMLEAMACGVPPLAHRACGCADVVTNGEDGILMDLEDDANLETALAHLIENRNDLPELGKTARHTAETCYSLDAMATGYANLYETALRGG